jgi:hypothetical protein
MKRACISVVLMLLSFVTTATSPAWAEKTRSPKKGALSTECTEMAKAAGLSNWFCVGGNVYDAKTGEKKSDNLTRRQLQNGASAADDYDLWCEPTGICDRQISNYILESKANYEWGLIDSNGNYTHKGDWDAILRINLNGRSARFSQTLIWDSGPGLYFPRVWAVCYEEIPNWPDTVCGDHTTGQGVYITPGGWRWDGPLFQGNYLANSNEYYLQFQSQARPTGYDQTMDVPYFESPYFYCYGGDPCYFP